MGKLFSLFKYGFITIFTSPFWLLYYAYHLVKGLFIFLYDLVKAIVLFFSGQSLLNTREDKAIEKLKNQDKEEMAKRRQEALDDVK